MARLSYPWLLIKCQDSANFIVYKMNYNVLSGMLYPTITNQRNSNPQTITHPGFLVQTSHDVDHCWDLRAITMSNYQLGGFSLILMAFITRGLTVF